MQRRSWLVKALTVTIVLLVAPHLFAEAHWAKFYDEAPVIQVIDPMATLVGSVPEEKNILRIHLTDVALYTGHVCPGVASGFMLTRLALKALYPDQIPRRGQVRVAAMAPSGQLDVASYITGARAFYGRGRINAHDLAIDPSLEPKEPGRFVMVFQRKDTGKAVKVVFYKSKLIAASREKAVNAYFHKAFQGKATDKEKEDMRKEIQSLVRKVLFGTSEGLFEIATLRGYSFPQASSRTAR